MEVDIGFPILSDADPELAVIDAFGVGSTNRKIALPAVFVIRDGQIVWRQIGETIFDRAEIDQIIAAIEGRTGS